jgi:hypothetical protein
MSLAKLLLAIVVGSGAYYSWNGTGSDAAAEFTDMPTVTGYSRTAVLVVAAKNCSSDAAKRADQLTTALAEQGILVHRIDEVNFNPAMIRGEEHVQQIRQVMEGTLPIVFVDGRASNNPKLEQVIAQYEKGGS